MKTLLKAAIAGALIASLACGTVSAAPVIMNLKYDGVDHRYNAEEIKLIVNGNKITTKEMPPVILSGRTYVPSREVFEPLGAVVDWKANTKELYIGYQQSLIILKPNSPTAVVNGLSVNMAAPAKIINDKLMVPVRFVAEGFGIAVGWDDKTREVTVGSPAITVIEPIVVENPQPVQPLPQTSTHQTETITSQPQAPANVPGLSTDVSTQQLTEMSLPAVTVNSVSLNGTEFSIQASGQISKVQKLLLSENKLVIDIFNADNGLSKNSYTFSEFSGVSSVRNSQFQTDPEKITRIVFDLVGQTKFSVSLDSDRKTVRVKFDQVTVTKVDFGVAGISDVVTITSDSAANVKVERIYAPNRVQIDVLGAKLAPGITGSIVQGNLTKAMNISTPNESTVRISFDVTSDVQYTINKDGNKTTVTMTPPTYKNITYTSNPPTLTLKGVGVETSQLSHNDNYFDYEYTITLPKDCSQILGYGIMNIDDAALDNIEIVNEGGRTKIVINENNTYAYKVNKSGNDLIINPVNPKDMYKTVVYIDAGHGKDDPGTRGGGMSEKDVNLSIIQKLHTLLENDPDIKVYASRLDDSYPQNSSRAIRANSVADLFLSVHQNSASSSANGTETLYYNHRGEEYPKLTSEAAARIIQTNLVNDIGTADRGVVKRPDLIVLNTTNIPAVLVEIEFMSYQEDVEKVDTEEERQVVAESLYRSIKQIFQEYPTGR